jgi:hypothetical protein
MPELPDYFVSRESSRVCFRSSLAFPTLDAGLGLNRGGPVNPLTMAMDVNGKGRMIVYGASSVHR